MSWFTSGLDKLSQLSEQVQKVIPVDKDLLAKLTLNTDEMKAERAMFGEEAKRKAATKDMLAGMLPWETKDAERDILVEECKDAILALSSQESTFYGPYEMPQLKVNLAASPSNDEDEEKQDDHDEEEEEDGEKHEEAIQRNKPSEESLQKLAKLEPLPPLLRDFDLDSHVGLIERLLKIDPMLQQRQSNLSGGGDREKVFWHNYFFHCAYTRYEAGLSIDEIWSFQPAEEKAANEASSTSISQASAEETVVFDGGEDEQAALDSISAPDEINGENVDATESASGVAVSSNSPSESTASDYELVDGGTSGANAADSELDELEAEIARELEDL